MLGVDNKRVTLIPRVSSLDLFHASSGMQWNSADFRRCST